MNYPVDRTGKRYGSLVARFPQRNYTPGQGVLWYCLCDCGRWVVRRITRRMKSCGCGRVHHRKQTRNQELLTLADAGTGYAELSTRFGIAISRVWCIVQRERKRRRLEKESPA